MTVVKIDESKWMRSHSNSCLYDGVNYCVIGKCLIDSGVPLEMIIGKSEINDLLVEGVDMSLYGDVGNLVKNGAQVSDVLRIMEINDGIGKLYSLEEKKQLLVDKLKPLGFNLEFF
jgi:hypothetical protein